MSAARARAKGALESPRKGMDSAPLERGAAPTALYRLYNREDRLVYVGVTYQLEKRLYQHARDKPWWPEVARQEVDWHEHRRLALAEETRLIELYDPPYNGAHARKSLKEMNGRIDAAASRAGMSRSQWLRKVIKAALDASEARTGTTVG